MNRAIKTDMYNILDIIACASDYGHTNHVLIHSLFELTGKVTKEDIMSFAKHQFLSEDAISQGYNHEDYEQAIETIVFYAEKHNALL